MRYPECYEPDRMAEALEAEYDRKCEMFPHCAQCGSSLYPCDTYTELSSQLFCEKCVTNNTRSTADLEVF